MSEQLKPVGGLFAAMAAVMGEISRIPKSGRNEYFKYDYATEADLLDVLRPAMAKHGLAFYVSCTGSEVIDTNGARGGNITRVHIAATFGCAATGESVTVSWYGDGQDTSDKGLSKAYTAAIKYLLLKTFLVSSGDDPDADEAPVAKPAAKAPPAQRAPTPAKPLESAGAVFEAAIATLPNVTQGLARTWRKQMDDAKTLAALSAVATKLHEAEGVTPKIAFDALREYGNARRAELKAAPVVEAAADQATLDEADEGTD